MPQLVKQNAKEEQDIPLKETLVRVVPLKSVDSAVVQLKDLFKAEKFCQLLVKQYPNKFEKGFAPAKGIISINPGISDISLEIGDFTVKTFDSQDVIHLQSSCQMSSWMVLKQNQDDAKKDDQKENENEYKRGDKVFDNVTLSISINMDAAGINHANDKENEEKTETRECRIIYQIQDAEKETQIEKANFQQICKFMDQLIRYAAPTIAIPAK